MLTLFCVVVGEGSAFPVKIAADESIGILKEMIREKNPSTIKCDAKDLQLYLALKNNEWLSDDADLAAVASGNTDAYIRDRKPLDARLLLSAFFLEETILHLAPTYWMFMFWL